MSLLTRDQILSVDDFTTELVAVPEWGGEVLVRTLTGNEKDRWEELYTAEGDGKRIRASIAALSICDEQGEPIFSEDDIEALGKKSALAFDRILAAAKRLNAVTEEDLDELEKK